MFATFGVGQVIWSLVWFFLFFLWIMLVFQVFADIFRSRDLGGAAKAAWVLFVVVAPYIGTFVYLIARGGKMHEHQLARAQAEEQMLQDYLASTIGAASAAGQIAKLVDLKDQGVLDEGEFARLKARVVA
ncbi:hypothetical protein BH10ACT1_BH10ACT1_11730 [soil metagenome]